MKTKEHTGFLGHRGVLYILIFFFQYASKLLYDIAVSYISREKPRIYQF